LSLFLGRWPENGSGTDVDELDDLQATQRQLERFRRAGLFDQASLQALQSTIEIRRQDLLKQCFGSVGAIASGFVSNAFAPTVILALMLGAIALAWPRPQLVSLVSILNFLALSHVAFRQRLPLLHGVALVCLGVVFLTIAQALRGNDLGDALWSAASGAAGVVFVLIVAGSVEALYRWHRQADALVYSVAAAVVAIVSMSLVTLSGDAAVSLTPAAVFAVYGCVFLALNARWR